MTPEEIKAFIAAKVKEGVAEAEAKLLAEAEAKRISDEKIKVEVDKQIDEKMKSINFSGNKFSDEKELKIFNPNTGKIDGIKKVDEMECQFNNMLKSLATRNFNDAQAISREIDKQNAKDAIILRHKAPTPTRSDSDAVGGYAVPNETDARIMQMIYAGSVMYSRMNKDAIIANGKIYPLMYGLTIADIADQSTAITESNPTFTNPTIAVARAGAFSAISNEILAQKGIDITNAFENGYASAMARFLDLRLAVGNVTGTSDLVDGIVFDPNTVLDTEVSKANFALSSMEDQLNAISDEADSGSLVFIGNRVVRSLIGNLENGAGQRLFPEYISGGALAPLGVPFILNSKIPSVLNVGGDARTGGTDNVLILADMSKCMTVLDNTTRIELSKDFYFTSDLTAIKGVKRYGSKVLVSTTASTGGVCRALEITA